MNKYQLVNLITLFFFFLLGSSMTHSQERSADTASPPSPPEWLKAIPRAETGLPAEGVPDAIKNALLPRLAQRQRTVTKTDRSAGEDVYPMFWLLGPAASPELFANPQTGGRMLILQGELMVKMGEVLIKQGQALLQSERSADQPPSPAPQTPAE